MAKPLVTIDYFKLPFEVHYTERVSVTQYEFMSDAPVNRFEDIKLVHMEQGQSWGPKFLCEENNGPELYCCLMNLHDEVAPTWLNFQDEEDLNLNYGCNYGIKVENNEIKFVGLSDEQEDEDSEDYLDVNDMEDCCGDTLLAYQIGDATPDFIILDAENSRVKIDLDGYELDDEGSRIESRRIINTDDINDDKYEDFDNQELWEAKSEWVKSILERNFPKDKNLYLSRRTE